MAAADEEFDLFVRTNASVIRRYAWSLAQDTWLADDIVQETFLRAWRFWSSFRGQSSRRGWVLRICRNVAFDQLKSRTARERNEQNLMACSSGESAKLLPIPMTATSISWVDEVSVLKQLTLQHREVIALVDLLGFDYRTTAHVLEIPVGTVRSRLRRARESYRRMSGIVERTAESAGEIA